MGMYSRNDLHRAAEIGQEDAIHQAIAKGENPNVKDFLRRTPLQCAAQYDHLKIVDILLQAGSDVSIVDHDRRTAADHGVLSKPQNWKKVLSLLRKEEARRYKDFEVEAASMYTFTCLT